MDDTITGLIDIVGAAGVFDSPPPDGSASLDHELIPPLRPGCVVRPQNVDEVQAIVEWANRTLTPLVPVSSGGPHFRGDTDPSVPEAVMVDLSGMDRILRIDRRNRLALIEPGVTYTQLQPALAEHGLRIVSPLLPRANKSVIASLLEREPVMSPRFQWNLLEPLRSLEIVWGNGEVFYSGSGTFRGERDSDWEQGLVPLQGPGPGQLDFYRLISAAQGSMGIATWASVKCEVLPARHKLYLAPVERLEDLIDFTYRLLRFRFGDELFIANAACLAAILGDDAAAIAALRGELPAWTAVVGISSGQMLPDERLAAREADVRDIAQQFGLRLQPAVPGCRGGELLERLARPSGQPYWKLRARGGSQEVFFLTTLDGTPGFVETMAAAAGEHGYPASDVGVYLQPVHQGAGCHCEFLLPFDPAGRADRDRTCGLFRDASRRLFRQGAYFSRPYGIWADMVYNGDAQTTLVTRKIKGIFDPRGVMNPGKLCF